MALGTNESLLLLVGSGIFLAGALIAQLVGLSKHHQDTMHAFVGANVCGVLFFHTLPVVVEHRDVIALAWLLGGIVFPLLLERVRGHADESQAGEPISVLLFSTFAIAMHVLVESFALAIAQDFGGHHFDGHHTPFLGLSGSVIIHRLPVSVVLFEMVRKRLSIRWAWAVVCAIALCSLLAFVAGFSDYAYQASTWLLEDESHRLEALVAGLLLHIVFFPHAHGDDSHGHHDAAHAHDHSHQMQAALAHPEHAHQPQNNGVMALLGIEQGYRRLSRFFAFLLGGASAFVALGPDAHGAPADVGSHSFIESFYTLLLESAPALLLGFALAGVVKFWMRADLLRWLSTGGLFARIHKGILIGLPLPICSCGVLPVYQTLAKHGVPISVSLAFLIATPEIGIDAMLLSVSMLGWSLTAARMLGAFCVAWAVALLVAWWIREKSDTGREAVVEHSHASQDTPASIHRWHRLREGLRFGLVEMVDHILPWVLVGLFIAALFQSALGDMISLWAMFMPTWLQVLLAALVGIPMYVCASGATPWVAVMLGYGISPGAGVAFLLAGPATNVTTFVVLRRLHGVGVAATFALGVIGFSTLFGWGIDAWVMNDAWGLGIDVSTTHIHTRSWISQWSVYGIALLGLGSVYRQGLEGVLAQILSPIENTHHHHHHH